MRCNTYGTEPTVSLTKMQVKHFKVGSAVDLPDGIYLGIGGFLVVAGGKLAGTYSQIFSGEKTIEAEDLLKQYPLSTKQYPLSTSWIEEGYKNLPDV